MIAMETVSIFLIAAGVLLIVIAIVSFFSSARENPKPVIDVSLPELASVWLKYNDEVTAINDIPEGVESLYKNKCDTGTVEEIESWCKFFCKGADGKGFSGTGLYTGSSHGFTSSLNPCSFGSRLGCY